MAILSFRADDVRRIVTHASGAPGHDMGWLTTVAPQPAVMPVGDHGVYLMSNGSPRDPADRQTGSTFVAHALGIDPTRDADWWEAKCALHGVDDGADTLCIIDDLTRLLARGEAFIRLEIGPDHVGVIVPDVTWIGKGALVETPSGRGGVFRARVLSVTDTHASVRNTGNAEDGDDRPPYRVPLGHLRPLEAGEAV